MQKILVPSGEKTMERLIMGNKDSLELRFHKELIKGYEETKRECGYNATRFIQDVSKSGGLTVAKKLIGKPGGSDGFTKLWEAGRLDLSVEACALRPEFKPLFTEKELETCRERLKAFGYNI